MNDKSRLYPIWSLCKLVMLALGILDFACTSSYEKKIGDKVKVIEANPSIVIKPPSSFEDTVIIKDRSSVFYNPDTVQLMKMKSAYDQRVYDTQKHDCYYMTQNARNVIREHWPGLRIVEVNRARFLLFIKKDGHKIYIDLNTKNDMCGMYIFDPQKDPEPIDMPNVATYLGFYFGQQ